MGKRSYKQHCLLARALDVIGERWTLLIVRDLLMGPKRYSDLATGLPGLGTNLLAERLKTLESEGLLERTRLPAPASSMVYRLTPAGAALEKTILALSFWGVRYMARGNPEDLRQLAWPFLALRGMFEPDRAQGLNVTVAFVANDERVWLQIRDGAVATGSGVPPEAPSVELVASADDVRALLFAGLDVRKAKRSGRIKLRGDTQHFTAAMACFATE